VKFGGAGNNRTLGTVGAQFFPATAEVQSFLATAVTVRVATTMAVAVSAAVTVLEEGPSLPPVKRQLQKS